MKVALLWMSKGQVGSSAMCFCTIPSSTVKGLSLIMEYFGYSLTSIFKQPVRQKNNENSASVPTVTCHLPHLFWSQTRGLQADRASHN